MYHKFRCAMSFSPSTDKKKTEEISIANTFEIFTEAHEITILSLFKPIPTKKNYERYRSITKSTQRKLQFLRFIMQFQRKKKNKHKKIK